MIFASLFSSWTKRRSWRSSGRSASVLVYLELHVHVLFEAGARAERPRGAAAFGPVSHCKKLNAGKVQSLEWEQGFLPPQGGYRDRA
ncbi:hypothetical protein KPA99_05685, partial [Burkholderia cenocepacia]|nr:hypothetical protein [Burkholderia cenocepacia]